MKRKQYGTRPKSFLKRIGLLLLLLVLALSPVSSSTSQMDFLDAISLEITGLEKNWENLTLDLQKQETRYQALEMKTEIISLGLKNNETKFQTLEKDIKILQEVPKRLETEFKTLNNSLKQSEKDLKKLKIKNDILTVVLVGMSVVAVSGLIVGILN